MLVVTDGSDPATEAVAARHGARFLALPAGAGANAKRNAGVASARGELIVFIDDDIEAPAGWLSSLLAGAGGALTYGKRLEGGGPRACGRESAPITTLDLGSEDREAELVWGANMAVRRRALERVGILTADERSLIVEAFEAMLSGDVTPAQVGGAVPGVVQRGGHCTPASVINSQNVVRDIFQTASTTSGGE